MSYTADRREFIAIMKAETPSMPAYIARAIMAQANQLHQIAEDDCSNEAAYLRMEQRRAFCPTCKAEAPHDRTYTTTEKSCPCPEHRAQGYIREWCEKFNVVPHFDGDPRGAVVKLKVPSGRNNSFGGGGFICVPTRGTMRGAAMNTKHTPKPWRVTNSRSVETAGPTPAEKPRFRFLLTTLVGGFPTEEWEANARLIAAAPELKDELDPDGLQAVADTLARDFANAALCANLREKIRRERALLARIDGASTDRFSRGVK